MNELEAALESIANGSAQRSLPDSLAGSGRDPSAYIWRLQEIIEAYERVAQEALAVYRGEVE